MIGRIHSLVYDAADIAASSAFYQQLAGFKEHYVDDDWITLTTPTGEKVCFQLAPDHVPPRWPDPRYPQHFHLDFRTPDMAGDVERAVSLGATRLEGGGDTWTVVADPAGHPLCLCQNDEVSELTLQDIAIDSPDGKALGEFYAAVLGYEIPYVGPEGAYIAGDGPAIMFQNIAEYHAPRWPDPAFPQQAHLDIVVDDIDASEAKVLELGATELRGGGNPKTQGYRVFTDPAGHPFCLVWGQ